MGSKTTYFCDRCGATVSKFEYSISLDSSVSVIRSHRELCFGCSEQLDLFLAKKQYILVEVHSGVAEVIENNTDIEVGIEDYDEELDDESR